MGVPLRQWTYWAAGYGIPGAALKLLAWRGDPLAQLATIDANPVNDIYPLIEQVRERGRMYRVVESNWASADAQIVREVQRDRRFRTIKQRDRSPFGIGKWILAKTNPEVLNPLEPPSMLVADPPEHTRLRRLVSQAFTPRALNGLRARVHEIVDELLRGLEDGTECDLVAEYASQIAIAVIADMLAIPRDEIGHLQSIGESVTTLIGTMAASWSDFRAATKAMRELDQYLTQHTERLRKDDDANSILSDVVRNGDLTDFEIRVFAALLLGAGFTTTSNVMGKAVVALLHHPDQLAVLRVNPEGWPNAIEEILRYDTTGQLAARIAIEDINLHGYDVRAGDTVFLLPGGANRDPTVFEDPHSFDITRTNAREHISFAAGVHVCLGAALARMELHIGLQSLFEHFPQLALVGEPTYNDSIGLHGFKHLPVALGAANL